VEDWGELDVPARCRTEGESTFVPVSGRRCHRACPVSHNFYSFCRCNPLFAYICSTGVSGAIHRCFKNNFMLM